MKKIILYLTLFLCVVVLLHSDNSKNNYKGNTHIDTTLNEQNVYLALLINNIKFPEVVISQIMIESGNLTSRLCKKNNNLLGMTVASKRETTALNKKGYAKYKSWLDCILDYKLYQDYILSKNQINNKNQYIVYLHKNYANAPDYKQKLTFLSKKYELRNSFNYTTI
jgi:uncharacterized FlgJ-related protein